MKLLKYGIAVFLIYSVFSVASPALAYPESNLSSRLSGKILLDVDNKGEAWYVYPGDFHRYYLGTPSDAYDIMKYLSLGVSNDNFIKIASSTEDRFKGLILLKPEDNGQAYYVNPDTKVLTYLADATGAYALMREDSLGITSQNLETIPIGKIILNDTGQAVKRQWQYLGWWGAVKQNYVPVMTEPNSVSKRLGYLYQANTVKILDLKKDEDGVLWYKIDGGQYPGAYINSTFINTIAQPTPTKEVVLPSDVAVDDYWLDVNITKNILTVYKYDQVVMATYVSTGLKETPTIYGLYHVWYKLYKTRMTGNPPTALHAYDLIDVPWTMYYKGSFAVHGTYWHDNFGSQRSAGCTNMTQGDAKFIFDLTNPVIDSANSVRSTIDNPGVVVNNHY